MVTFMVVFLAFVAVMCLVGHLVRGFVIVVRSLGKGKKGFAPRVAYFCCDGVRMGTFDSSRACVAKPVMRLCDCIPWDVY